MLPNRVLNQESLITTTFQRYLRLGSISVSFRIRMHIDQAETMIIYRENLPGMAGYVTWEANVVDAACDELSGISIFLQENPNIYLHISSCYSFIYFWSFSSFICKFQQFFGFKKSLSKYLASRKISCIGVVTCRSELQVCISIFW